MITCPICGSNNVYMGEKYTTLSYFLFQDFDITCSCCGSKGKVRVTWDRDVEGKEYEKKV